MATYYFFRMDSEGHITSREEHDCGDDADALETARTLMDGHDIEVWLGAVRIGAVNRKYAPEGQALFNPRSPLNLD